MFLLGYGSERGFVGLLLTSRAIMDYPDRLHSLDLEIENNARKDLAEPRYMRRLAKDFPQNYPAY